MGARQYGNYAALYPAADQLAFHIAPPPRVKLGRTPAVRLRMDVRKQLRKRFEFDKPVNRKRDGSAIFPDDRGRRNQILQSDLLCG